MMEGTREGISCRPSPYIFFPFFLLKRMKQEKEGRKGTKEGDEGSEQPYVYRIHTMWSKPLLVSL
jgi:hypothetical protein